ncbi:MAG: hypothetical protein KJP23_18200 [Deltaproteobacteria bacterium]|nr:hypothetical protein [Deltaproteobacteria bacterium]
MKIGLDPIRDCIWQAVFDLNQGSMNKKVEYSKPDRHIWHKAYFSSRGILIDQNPAFYLIDSIFRIPYSKVGGIFMIGHAQKILSILMVFAVIVSCGSFQTQSKPAAVPEIRPGILAGYLKADALPNSLVLLPPPRAQSSAAFALDEEVSRKSFALRGTPRWELAISDLKVMIRQIIVPKPYWIPESHPNLGG